MPIPIHYGLLQLDFLLKECGFTKETIIDNPAVCALSLQGRIRPRHAICQYRGERLTVSRLKLKDCQFAHCMGLTTAEYRAVRGSFVNTDGSSE